MKIQDDWAALQFDNAVTFLGLAIENAAQEMHNVGPEDQPKMEPKYKTAQLLDPAFRLPRSEQAGFDLAIEGVEGVAYDEVG